MWHHLEERFPTHSWTAVGGEGEGGGGSGGSGTSLGQTPWNTPGTTAALPPNGLFAGENNKIMESPELERTLKDPQNPALALLRTTATTNATLCLRALLKCSWSSGRLSHGHSLGSQGVFPKLYIDPGTRKVPQDWQQLHVPLVLFPVLSHVSRPHTLILLQCSWFGVWKSQLSTQQPHLLLLISPSFLQLGAGVEMPGIHLAW